MDYAVNVADMTKPEYRFGAALLVAPVKGGIVDAEPGRIDGYAVMLNCDEERARAIVDVLRIKASKNLLRCYQRSKKAWRRI